MSIESVDALIGVLDDQDYLADELLATALFLAIRMRRPLLLEGEAGTGKTEVAKALSSALGCPLIRLQCYEGIDASQALYEWDHARQLLHLRAVEVERAHGHGTTSTSSTELENDLYTERFLLRRPLLQAIDAGAGASGEGSEVPAVLLIDEIDRSDDEFEAFLLEVLSDWSITIPELGAVHATRPPAVVITSNRTRDVHDALKRRCLYHWVEHPDPERELRILRRRVPGLSEALAAQVADATAVLRGLGLHKPPGVAEAIDWATALATLGCATIDPATIERTMAAVLKYHEDQERVRSSAMGEIAAAVSA